MVDARAGAAIKARPGWKMAPIQPLSVVAVVSKTCMGTRAASASLWTFTLRRRLKFVASQLLFFLLFESQWHLKPLSRRTNQWSLVALWRCFVIFLWTASGRSRRRWRQSTPLLTILGDRSWSLSAVFRSREFIPSFSPTPSGWSLLEEKWCMCHQPTTCTTKCRVSCVGGD